MPARSYQILIRGATAQDVLADLQGAHVGTEVQTLLTGSVRDQAELQGLLRRLHNLGLELIDLHQVSAPQEDAASSLGGDAR